MAITWSNEIIHHVPEALLVVDETGLIVWSNDQIADLLGYQSEELQGCSVELLIPERYREGHPKHRETYSQKPTHRQMGANKNLYARNKQGGEIPVDIALNHMRRDGKTWIFVALRSDAQQREQRNRIDKQAEFLRQSQAVGGIGSWDWRIGDDYVEWSEEIYHIFGVEPYSFDASYDIFLSYVHPDDRDRVSLAVTEAVDNDVPYRIEHRVIQAGGNVRQVCELGRVYRDEVGRPIRMLGTLQDVTKDREKQARLFLSRVVFDNSAEGIVILDDNFNVIDANPAFNRFTEISNSKNTLGLDKLSHPQSPNSGKFILQQVEKNNQWKGEFWIKSLSREVIPTLTTIAAVNDEGSKHRRYVVTMLDVADLKDSEDQLKFLTDYDQLTLLPNRKRFLRHLKDSLSKAADSDDELAVIYIDLDGFKKINDSQGFDVGDELLKEISGFLQQLKSKYIYPARISGDEFALCVHANKADLLLESVAKVLVAKLNFRKIFEGLEFEISVSAGISRYRYDGFEYMELLRKADQAMHQAKKNGRNMFCYYDAAIGERELDDIKLSSAMREALSSDQFELHYQPKVSLESNAVVGLEALVRWHHPQRGLISPVDFIPLAESNGLIVPIGLEVLAKACALLKEKNINPAKVAINLSAKQLHSPSLIDDIDSAIKKYKLLPGALEVEVTESVAMDDVENNLNILNGIKALGVSISIDDFGTGYSSLSYLKQLPVDTLKIDRSFIFNLASCAEDKAIVTAIISLAKSLNLKVIAEGVENIEQLKLLTAMGCDEAQGFFLSRPVEESKLPAAVDDLLELLARI